MFKKREKNKPFILRIQKNGELVFEGIICDLPVHEDKIIEGSILFFDDPEPCMIHRSAVMSRYYMQMDKFLGERGYESGSIISYCDILEEIRVLFDINKC